MFKYLQYLLSTLLVPFKTFITSLFQREHLIYSNIPPPSKNAKEKNYLNFCINLIFDIWSVAVFPHKGVVNHFLQRASGIRPLAIVGDGVDGGVEHFLVFHVGQLQNVRHFAVEGD